MDVYRSETWIVIKKHGTRIQTPEMKFLCAVFGYTHTGDQRNTEIRKRLKRL